MVTVYLLNDFSTVGSDADGNRMKVGHLYSVELGTHSHPGYSACPAHKNKQTHTVTSQQEDGDQQLCTHCTHIVTSQQEDEDQQLCAHCTHIVTSQQEDGDQQLCTHYTHIVTSQ